MSVKYKFIIDIKHSQYLQIMIFDSGRLSYGSYIWINVSIQKKENSKELALKSIHKMIDNVLDSTTQWITCIDDPQGECNVTHSRQLDRLIGMQLEAEMSINHC